MINDLAKSKDWASLFFGSDVRGSVRRLFIGVRHFRWLTVKENKFLRM